MKKVLMTCMAVIALLAIAGSAGAITCTVDQRPAATLLVPYFEASIAPDGNVIPTGPNARDTIVTVCNASAAPMIVHVNLFSERTELVLDYNIALTGFDCQAMRMSDIVRGFLPRTGFVAGTPAALRDACQRNFGPGATQSKVYPAANGFIRVNPVSPATPLDNTLATTLYPIPAWPAGSQFAFEVLDSLDDTPDSRLCDPTPDGNVGGSGVDGVISGIIRGYLTLDHANYCNLSSPADALYYDNDAIGMENNMFGEVIFTSGSGIPTMGGSTVNIEAATDSTQTGPLDAPPFSPNRPFENQTDASRARTFYARYWTPSTESFCTNVALLANSPWNCAEGDAREALGLKYAARWFSTEGITSNFNVWRGSSGELTDLLGTPFTDCTDELPVVSLTFFDEDENTVSQGVCPSPCTQPQFNFPLETQRVSIAGFAGATPTAAAGWVSMSFFNGAGPNNGSLDQAWVEYDFQGPGAFLSISSPATQLDPSACNPLGVTGVQNIGPVIPVIVGSGP